ncbi:DsbA family oxidoreductase [Streptomyces sp. A3M-1-3]|uniref:DsbA family oxidoreductase n=1 Tax=Streptomyces sp. A3M-1-3 TaxID=2962044 RepID=UPI0020B6A33E|nr:DsbA family oxidoreductase [Streptomyces sp. A3M-1-3]MCP3817863.1 DsbA family oxidoreductase [Streptomyces sp. A3M-1-3]
MDLNTRTPRTVEFVLDLICVHSYIAFTRFSRAAALYRDAGGVVDIVFRPCQVAPDAPASGRPLFEVHKAAFGEQQARAIAQDTSFGAEDGLRVDFERAVHTNTFEAHRLLATAASQGAGEAMAERLFRAYMTDGLNIGDPGTLARLAAEIGVGVEVEVGVGVEQSEDGAAALTAELDRMRGLGITSVPLILFDNGTAFSGSQPESVYLKALATPPVPASAWKGRHR